ncbi:hypothetical protein D2T29_08190 [Sinirhodobacter populi]|uniref:Uncharacterized protein n=1 Tax=Paenirhodobacter populi TaxID=2306993 RepID=A0A443KJY0_9RHOB|nr:hypothetical protein [Sinirhodobacter populi]RWR33018.1 hypothetical protein D2T29_08190 [Sinirhodobacter populi]
MSRDIKLVVAALLQRIVAKGMTRSGVMSRNRVPQGAGRSLSRRRYRRPCPGESNRADGGKTDLERRNRPRANGDPRPLDRGCLTAPFRNMMPHRR